MAAFPVLVSLLLFLPPLSALPVTQAISTDTLIYDAVVVGTNSRVGLRPAPTGLPSPTPTFTVGSTAYTRITGAVATNPTLKGGPLKNVTSSSTAQTSNVGSLPTSESSFGQSMIPAVLQTPGSAMLGMLSKTSVPATIPGISTSSGVMAVVTEPPAGVAFATSTYNNALTTIDSSSAISGRLGLGANRTSTTTTTTSFPTDRLTFAVEVTNSQGSLTDEVIEVEFSSGIPSTNTLFAYADSVTTTETDVPAGVVIKTMTTSTCTNAGTVVTTTSSGSTVATEVPELCINGVAFLIFGLAGFRSSSDFPTLCHKSFRFPLGIIWPVLCPSGGPPAFVISSITEGTLPPGDGNPDVKNPTQNTRPSQNQVTQTQTQTSSRTTQRTSSPSASATRSRYLIMPLINTSQSSTDSLFAQFAQRKNVTQAKRGSGSLDFFALELNITEASIIDAKSDFIVIQESDLDIEMPDSGQTDPGLNGATYATEPLTSNPNIDINPKNLADEDKRSKISGLLKRNPLQGWAEKVTAWSLAIISLVPSLQLPSYGYDEVYPYYYADTVDPGQDVRVYLLDTGLNMQHPEFNGRLKPGINRGQTQNDWNIDWLFPTVDRREFFYTKDANGQLVRRFYEYSYIDPDSPNIEGGIHPAYSDFRLENVDYGRLTPHGTRVSAFIIGDELGQAQACHYTVVKLPQYTNGYRSLGTFFPLFSVTDALILIIQDIKERKEQGEKFFVICSALGHVFGSDSDENPIGARGGFERSVTPRALAHPESQGSIGDGILTAYAPGSGARMISSDPDGTYTYEYIDPAGSAVTSYACGVAVGYIAQTIALGYSGNAVIPPHPGEQPNAYAYRMVSSESKPRVDGGPPIIYNNAPIELYQYCGGPGGYRKRDGSCSLDRIDLPTGTDAIPASISEAIMAGEEGYFGGTATGIPPSLTGAINASSTLATASMTTAVATALCTHAADPQNTCAAVANGPGWCVCGDSPSSYAIQTSTNLPCGWTTLPQITQFDCTTASTTLSSRTTISPTPSTSPSPAPNAGIAIWLQQYSSSSGATVGTWFAYTYRPGDIHLGSPCSHGISGAAPVPNGTPVSEERGIQPFSMTISAYGRKLRFEAFAVTLGMDSWVMDLWDTETRDVLANCKGVVDAKGVDCDAERMLTPRATCEWAN